MSVVSLLWDDLLGGVKPTKTDGGDATLVETPSMGRRRAENA